MPRLFTAAVIPDEARDVLIGIRPPLLPGMRLNLREELHLTLHYVGDVTDEQATDAHKALARVRATAFSLTLRGVGQFPPEGQPRALWAGIEPIPPLLALHEAVAAVLGEAIGFRPEERPYLPHITLARLNAPVPLEVIDHYKEEHSGFHFPDVPITQFALYRSLSSGDAPRYIVEAVFSLQPRPPLT